MSWGGLYSEVMRLASCHLPGSSVTRRPTAPLGLTSCARCRHFPRGNIRDGAIREAPALPSPSKRGVCPVRAWAACDGLCLEGRVLTMLVTSRLLQHARDIRERPSTCGLWARPHPLLGPCVCPCSVASPPHHCGQKPDPLQGLATGHCAPHHCPILCVFTPIFKSSHQLPQLRVLRSLAGSA